MKKFIRRQMNRSPLDYWAWTMKGNRRPPLPHRMKMGVLTTYGDPSGVWIESGTYLGRTTQFLARSAKHVFTIEPSVDLARRADRRFRGNSKVSVINGLSECELPKILSESSGSISLFLDGHFSSGETFRGPFDTPIIAELTAVENFWDGASPLAILVDDFRCFASRGNSIGSYPSRGFLIDFAERMELNWTVEFDIFACWSESTE